MIGFFEDGRDRMCKHVLLSLVTLAVLQSKVVVANESAQHPSVLFLVRPGIAGLFPEFGPISH